MTMTDLELLLAGVLLVALTLYVLTGGADFGAGVWSLLATGPRGTEQRRLIDRAIAPIWEANHVWLILVVTVLFTAFPTSFAVISTRLHIPLTLLLLGIILRGSAFVLRTHDPDSDPDRTERKSAMRFWQWLFGLSSILSPIMLGIVIGAISSGRLDRGAVGYTELFVRPWVGPWPLAVGGLSLALVTFLAAVYLTVEASELNLKRDFRARAAVSWGATVLFGVMALALARQEAPAIYRGLIHTGLGQVLIGFTTLTAIASLATIRTDRDRAARVAAAALVTGILWGWASAQYPYIVMPSMTLFDSAPRDTMRLLLASLFLGALLLFPSLYGLYRLFKGSRVRDGSGP
jgi:cytochrome d ubiquinol oxidase subunit II